MTNTPIVLTAFGTTSRALDTYRYMDGLIRDAFPEHPVAWAYTSRMVRDRLKKHTDLTLEPPERVLGDLYEKGHGWAVVQSLHLICGHEFYRLIDDIKDSPVRSSTGLPLLTEPEDYEALIGIMEAIAPNDPGTATVFVGHGTDHPAWTAYPALSRMMEKRCPSVYVGTVEEGENEREAIVADVCGKGFTRVHLVPLMLVAGVHLNEDIAGDDDSWKTEFEARGLDVSWDSRGLGKNDAVVGIFIRHIKDALAMVP